MANEKEIERLRDIVTGVVKIYPAYDALVAAVDVVQAEFKLNNLELLAVVAEVAGKMLQGAPQHRREDIISDVQKTIANVARA